MELEKVKIHRIQQNGTAVSQITLDDDYNVPDYRPDIMKVLKENGELRFDEVKAANKAVWVKGSLVFHILYQCEQRRAAGERGGTCRRRDRGSDSRRNQFEKIEHPCGGCAACLGGGTGVGGVYVQTGTAGGLPAEDGNLGLSLIHI